MKVAEFGGPLAEQRSGFDLVAAVEVIGNAFAGDRVVLKRKNADQCSVGVRAEDAEVRGAEVAEVREDPGGRVERSLNRR